MRTGRANAILTKFGFDVDGMMLGAEIPQPADSRWQVWSANQLHPCTTTGCSEIWISRVYLVQVVREAHEWTTLMIRRIDGAEIRERWDELQMIKNDIAGAEALAIEVFPPTRDVVNMANLRHIRIVPDDFALPCVWRRK